MKDFLEFKKDFLKKIRLSKNNYLREDYGSIEISENISIEVTCTAELFGEEIEEIILYIRKNNNTEQLIEKIKLMEKTNEIRDCVFISYMENIEKIIMIIYEHLETQGIS